MSLRIVIQVLYKAYPTSEPNSHAEQATVVISHLHGSNSGSHGKNSEHNMDERQQPKGLRTERHHLQLTTPIWPPSIQQNIEIL